MVKDKKVGFLEEVKGQFESTLRFILTSEDAPWELKLRANNNIVSEEDTLWWLEERIVPRTRHNIDEIIKELGLSEYSMWHIVTGTNAMSLEDYSWINFSGDLVYEKDHVRYKIEKERRDKA